MKHDQVIEKIKEIADRVLPEEASLWLYGSRARGDARPDSDSDLLILLDKDAHMQQADETAYDMAVLGWDLSVEINTHVYPKSKWDKWTYSPFYKNVEHDKIVLR